MGSAQRILIEVYLALERAKEGPSVNRAIKAARALGYNVHKSDACRWLKPFATKPGTDLEPLAEPLPEPEAHLYDRGSEGGSQGGSSSFICTVPEAVPKAVPDGSEMQSSEPPAEPAPEQNRNQSGMVLPHTPSPANASLVSNLQQPGARAQEKSRGELSPAMALGQWFLQRGLELGVIPEHHGIDPYAWAYRQIEHSELLLKSYPKADIRSRAERLFAAHNAGKIRGSVTIASLAQKWDWDEVGATSRADRPTPPMVQREIDALREAEAHDAEMLRRKYAS